MQAGAEFYLVAIEEIEDEPVEQDGLILLPDNSMIIPAEVLHAGDYTTADVQKGGIVWFNKLTAQHIVKDIYAVPDKAILAFE